MKNRYIFVAIILTFIFSPKILSYESGQNYFFEGCIDVGTHCLFLAARGQGSPAFVLDVGVGGTYQDWLPILENMAQKTLMVAYDRAGYGRSNNGPFPRDCSRAAEELKKLLDKAGIPGPYILVGHSLGGLNVQIFALKYPEDTIGLVLLDPPPLDWILGDTFHSLKAMFRREVQNLKDAADASQHSEDQRERNRTNYLRTLASEHESLIDGANQLLISCQNKSWGNLPIYIIASGRPNPQFGDDAVRFQKYWNGQCRNLASRSSRGRYYFAAHSSHNIPQDYPELVIEVMKKILSEIQRGS